MSRVQRVVGRGLTVSIEGNIGVGKSTVLDLVRQRLERSMDVRVLPEPLDRWQNVDGHNLLQAFYDDPKRYAYLFQNFVFLTRFTQHHKGAAEHPDALRISERCIFTDRHVFADTAIREGLFSPVEASVYDAWYDPVMSSLPDLVPDAFVYLRATPDVCYRRLQQRARSEEVGVSLEYLTTLHSKHEMWFGACADGQIEGGERGRHLHSTGVLDRSHCHAALHGKPFVVVDCNATFDASTPTIRESIIDSVCSFLTNLLAGMRCAVPEAACA